MDAFPYALQAAARDGAAPRSPLRDYPCPHAPEGEHAALCQVRSKAELFRLLATLHNRAELRCLLLAPPAEPPAPDTLPITAEDLRAWLRDGAALCTKPVALLARQNTCPCGTYPLCEHTPEGRRRDELSVLDTLTTRAESLAAALDGLFPALSPPDLAFLQAWASRPDPADASRACPVNQLAQHFHISRRKAYLILARAKSDNPKLFAQMAFRRKHRLRKTGAYEVRT